MGARRFLGPGSAHEDIIHAEAAIFLVDAKAPDAERADLLVHLPWDFARLVPFVGVRLQFGFDEAAAGGTEFTAYVIVKRSKHVSLPRV